MSFIGESRVDYNHAWKDYLCLTEGDCKMIQKYVDKIVAQRQKKYDRLRDIHEGGEMTSRQETAMMLAEDNLEKARALQYDLQVFLKICKLKRANMKGAIQ